MSRWMYMGAAFNVPLTHQFIKSCIAKLYHHHGYMIDQNAILSIDEAIQKIQQIDCSRALLEQASFSCIYQNLRVALCFYVDKKCTRLFIDIEPPYQDKYEDFIDWEKYIQCMLNICEGIPLAKITTNEM